VFERSTYRQDATWTAKRDPSDSERCLIEIADARALPDLVVYTMSRSG